MIKTELLLLLLLLLKGTALSKSSPTCTVLRSIRRENVYLICINQLLLFFFYNKVIDIRMRCLLIRELANK